MWNALSYAVAAILVPLFAGLVSIPIAFLIAPLKKRPAAAHYFGILIGYFTTLGAGVVYSLITDRTSLTCAKLQLVIPACYTLNDTLRRWHHGYTLLQKDDDNNDARFGTKLYSGHLYGEFLGYLTLFWMWTPLY